MATVSISRRAKQSFHDYWFGLTRQERDRIIAKLKTSDGYMKRLALGHALAGTPFVARLIRLTGLDFWAVVGEYERRKGAIV